MVAGTNKKIGQITERGFVIRTLMAYIEPNQYFTIANTWSDRSLCFNYRDHPDMTGRKFKTFTEGTIVTIIRIK